MLKVRYVLESIKDYWESPQIKVIDLTMLFLHCIITKSIFTAKTVSVLSSHKFSTNAAIFTSF